MVNKRKSLETTKGRDVSRRPKPMVAKAGATRKRTPYKDGGKVSHINEDICASNKGNSYVTSILSFSQYYS